MKKTFLILLFCVIGCKTHKKIQTTETNRVDSVKTELDKEKIQAVTDSNINVLVGKSLDVYDRTTVTEYPSFNPTKTISFNEGYKVNDYKKGRIFTSLKDTAKKYILDSVDGTLTITKNGKVSDVIEGVQEAKATNPMRKTVHEKGIKSTDTTKYSSSYHKDDQTDKLKQAKDSLSQSSYKKTDTDKGTKVSGWNLFIPLFIGIAVLAAVVIFIYKKKK